MQNCKGLIIISMLAVIPAMTNANSLSGVINLPGLQTAGPMAALEFKYDFPNSHIFYNISCTLTSDHKSSQQQTYIQLNGASGYYGHYINGKQLDGTHQGKINSFDNNTIMLTHVRSDPIMENAFEVINIDDTDTISVTNCSAVPSS